MFVVFVFFSCLCVKRFYNDAVDNDAEDMLKATTLVG